MKKIQLIEKCNAESNLIYEDYYKTPFKNLKQRLSFKLGYEDRNRMISVKLTSIKIGIILKYLDIWYQEFCLTHEPYMECSVKKHINNIAKLLQLTIIIGQELQAEFEGNLI